MLFVTKPFPYMQTNLLNDYILLVLGVKKMDIYLTAPKSNFFKEISSMWFVLCLIFHFLQAEKLQLFVQLNLPK